MIKYCTKAKSTLSIRIDRPKFSMRSIEVGGYPAGGMG